jgi:4-hydroxy-2-oxoheptanedioate aldolase
MSGGYRGNFEMMEQTPKIRTSFICTIPSAVVTQALAQAGADTVVIDQEHGAVGPENLHAMIASTAGTNCRPVVRVGKRDEAMVKLALDLGAAGIVFPLVNTAQEASDCVAMTRYPPKVGGTVVCNILIETKAAIDNIEAICAVEGISVLVLAPFDLSVELGCPYQFDNPVFLKAVEQFERATTAANVPRSTLAMTEQQVQSAIARGYSSVGLGFDVLMLKSAASTAIGWARQQPAK